MVRFFRQPVDDVLACLEPLIRVRSPFKSLLPMLLMMFVTWFVYVPVHELLHVFGCVAPGGAVETLQLQPRYGGTLLQPIFPFIEPGGEYAGRLSGFDTKESDLIYLATVFGPFSLSVLIGVPLIRLCTRRARPFLFGTAVVVGLAPFYNVPGDYYEMGSIIVTRVVTFLQGGGYPPAYESVRSDDIYALVPNLVLRPAELGLEGVGGWAMGIGIFVVSLAMAVLLAFVTYAIGGLVARLLVGPTSTKPLRT